MKNASVQKAKEEFKILKEVLEYRKGERIWDIDII